MSWMKRLLWGDDRDHRLIKVTMPNKFPAYVSPSPPPYLLHSAYSMAIAQQMQMAQLGRYQDRGGMGALTGSNIGQSLGLGVLGGMGGMFGPATGGQRW